MAVQPNLSRCSVPNDPEGHDRPFGCRVEDLDWIDEFARRIRPYIRVRQEDGVLIKMPMEVFKVNRTGLLLLEKVLSGTPVRRVAEEAGVREHPERIYQIHSFFCDVRDLLSGRLGGGSGRLSTEVSPFEESFTRLPVLSEIALTYACNLACSFCYAGCGTETATPGNPGKEKHPDRWKFWKRSCWYRKKHPERDPVRQPMTTAEVVRVIDKLAFEGKVPSTSFTGGEPTLRPDLPELIAHARAKGMRVNLITNGTTCASKRFVDRLVEAGLTSAQVSLEGPNAAVHEKLTGRPGSFERTLHGIRNLRDRGIHVHTNTTLCEGNADHLTGIIDLARDLGLPHVSMNHIIPTGTPRLEPHRKIRISYTKIGRYVLAARDHAAKVGIGFHWYSPTPFCIFNPVAHGLGNKGCAACDGLIHVSPSGEVLPCSSFAAGVGNLLEKGFESVWFGRKAAYYKKKRMAHPICRRCEHFSLCQGACTLYWGGMGYGELYRARFGALAGRFRKVFGFIRKRDRSPAFPGDPFPETEGS